MSRINYLVTPVERLVGNRLRLLPAFRRPLMALGAALALLGILLGIEATRLDHLHREAAATETRIAALADVVRQVRAVEQDVARLRALGVRIAAIRRSGDIAANEIASVGNALPADVWLTSLRRDGATIAIDGGARSVTAIATALDPLAHLSGTARLASARMPPGSRELRYSVVLEPRR